MTDDQFSRCVALVATYWPNSTRHWTPESVDAWSTLLIDLDYGFLVAAIQQAATEGREFAPGPGLLRSMALELEHPMPSADQAWGEVRAQISAVGLYRGTAIRGADGNDVPREPVWSHPLIGQVADAIGWHDLCMSETPMADRAHFLRMWSEAIGRERATTHMAPGARAILAARGLALPDMSAAKALTP